MPWTTPTLRQVREMVRDDITAALSGAVVTGNSVLRVMADAMAALSHAALRYIDWLSKQLLPDTAETEWLDRHGNIWLVNADGSIGRKAASYAAGQVTFTGTTGTTVPIGTRLLSATGIGYETIEEIVLGVDSTPADIVALTGGADGNLDAGTALPIDGPLFGADEMTTVVELAGGADEESDDDLRTRILLRIRNPPMGGALHDYVQWALAVPGVTRAWAVSDNLGAVSVRFLMDELRADNHGLPTPDDIAAVDAYLEQKRPVTVKDMYVAAPILQFYTVTISGLHDDTEATRGRIREAIELLDKRKSAPGQTMYRSWVGEAISSAIGEEHHELIFTTLPATSAGHMPTVETILYVA